MTSGEINTAERKALNEFDKWNDVTGFVPPHTSYYYEIQSLIEDAVHIGIQMSLYKKVNYDEDETFIRSNPDAI